MPSLPLNLTRSVELPLRVFFFVKDLPNGFTGAAAIAYEQSEANRIVTTQSKGVNHVAIGSLEVSEVLAKLGNEKIPLQGAEPTPTPIRRGTKKAFINNLRLASDKWLQDEGDKETIERIIRKLET